MLKKKEIHKILIPNKIIEEKLFFCSEWVQMHKNLRLKCKFVSKFCGCITLGKNPGGAHDCLLKTGFSVLVAL
jgi:hypothetical protein